jgi:hypothetical protein
VALGLGALACADMVYRAPGQVVCAVPHSAMTTLTALYLVGLTARVPWLAVAAGAVKLGLFLARKPDGMLALVRVAAGFVLPAAAWVACPDPLAPAVTAVSGEVVDRALFYAELRFLSPAVQGARDLERVVDG